MIDKWIKPHKKKSQETSKYTVLQAPCQEKNKNKNQRGWARLQEPHAQQ